MDAQTFLSSHGSGDGDYDGALIILVTSNVINNIVSWVADRDGFILGFRATVTSGFSASINADPPTGTPAQSSVYTGLLEWIQTTDATDRMQSAWKIPFKANDSVKFRTLAATSIVFHLYVGFRRTT